MLVFLGSQCASDLASDSFALKPRQNLFDFTRVLLMFRGLFFQDFTSCSGGKPQESVCAAGTEKETHDGAGLEPADTVPPAHGQESREEVWGVQGWALCMPLSKEMHFAISVQF